MYLYFSAPSPRPPVFSRPVGPGALRLQQGGCVLISRPAHPVPGDETDGQGGGLRLPRPRLPHVRRPLPLPLLLLPVDQRRNLPRRRRRFRRRRRRRGGCRRGRHTGQAEERQLHRRNAEGALPLVQLAGPAPAGRRRYGDRQSLRPKPRRTLEILPSEAGLEGAGDRLQLHRRTGPAARPRQEQILDRNRRRLRKDFQRLARGREGAPSVGPLQEAGASPPPRQERRQDDRRGEEEVGHRGGSRHGGRDTSRYAG